MRRFRWEHDVAKQPSFEAGDVITSTCEKAVGDWRERVAFDSSPHTRTPGPAAMSGQSIEAASWHKDCRARPFLIMLALQRRRPATPDQPPIETGHAQKRCVPAMTDGSCVCGAGLTAQIAAWDAWGYARLARPCVITFSYLHATIP